MTLDQARRRLTHPVPAEEADAEAPPLPRETALLVDGEVPLDQAASGRTPQPGPPRPDGSFDPHRGRGLWGNEHGPVTPTPADEAFDTETSESASSSGDTRIDSLRGSSPFGDAMPDARYTSLGFTIGMFGIFWTGSIDLVIVPGKEIGIFYSPRDVNSPAELKARYLTDDAYGVTPQMGFSVVKGLLWGDIFQQEGVSAYEGPFMYTGGGGAMLTGEAFTSADEATGNITNEIIGAGTGISVSVPSVEAHDYVTKSKLLFKFSFPWK